MKRRVIYQVLTDRFAGDEGRQLRELTRSGPAFRWSQFAGGTYQGLATRLEHISELGASAIWLSPVVEQSHLPGKSENLRQDGYHGYWARDFQKPNQRFGAPSDLSQLLRRCKSKNILPILDVVLNHSNPKYSADRGRLYKNNVLFADPENDNDERFHHLGDLDQSQPYDPVLWENCDLWSLADLNQDNKTVSDYLKRAHSEWINLGFKGVRIDAALHISANWLNEWRLFVSNSCDDCRFFYGEWWDGGPSHPVVPEYSRKSGMHMTDFEFASALRKWLAGLDGIEQLRKCHDLQDNFLDPDLKVNFLDNHDMPRVMNLMLNQGMVENEAVRRLAIGVAVLMFWRGVPCLYYGTELGLYTRRRRPGKPWGQDPYNREPMVFGRGSNELFEIIQLLCRLRKETDLVEHRLVLVVESDTNLTLQRGAFHLRLRLNDEGGPRGLSLWQEESLLWQHSSC